MYWSGSYNAKWSKWDCESNPNIPKKGFPWVKIPTGTQGLRPNKVSSLQEGDSGGRSIPRFDNAELFQVS